MRNVPLYVCLFVVYLWFSLSEEGFWFDFLAIQHVFVLGGR